MSDFVTVTLSRLAVDMLVDDVDAAGMVGALPPQFVQPEILALKSALLPI
jgi:hypothetical protein